MRLARVVGNVWGARQADSLSGQRLLVVQPLRAPAEPGSGEVELTRAAAAACRGGELKVVVDALGAGPGEVVLVAHGSRCRDLTLGADLATKEVTLAIVDRAPIQARDRKAGP